MKHYLEKLNNIIKERNYIFNLLIVLPLIAMVVCVLYGIILHPFLMPTMSTIAVELITFVILLLILCATIIVTVITLVVKLVIFAFKRNKESIDKMKKTLFSQTIVIVSVTIILCIVIVSSQLLAYTPPILDSNGNIMKNSIASLEKITLNNSEQWISIRSENVNKPVLLFLAGGPGGTEIAATRDNLKELEKHFVIVDWDQPGACKSYNSMPLNSITPETYINDGYALTNYLCERFGKEKIYIMGESWGSALGILLVQKYPEKYEAFIGTGQMISFADTEKRCYETALEIAKEKNDSVKIDQLVKQGPPVYYGKGVSWKIASYLMYLDNYANSQFNTEKEIAGPEYGLYDKINYFRGVLNTFDNVYPQLYDYDLRKQAANLEVPIYFLNGRNDAREIRSEIKFVQEYYDILTAPDKKLIWFENSGHKPWITEKDKFNKTVIDLIVK